jgi:hypothetical protein
MRACFTERDRAKVRRGQPAGSGDPIQDIDGFACAQICLTLEDAPTQSRESVREFK